MTTWTALTTLRDRGRADDLGEGLEALDPAPTGGGVFEIEDDSGTWEVGAYFTEAPDEIALALLAAAHAAADFVLSEVPETDWVAHVRRELSPVEAGRFFVYGSHDAGKVPDDRVALLIEAAMAFGTGHHGTTLGCLRALDRLIDEGVHARRTVDIGCGTAVLAMAAAKTWPETVLASDIDAVAVEVADANVAANDLAGRVTCIEATGFDHEALRGDSRFDLIFANILKGPLLAMAPELSAALETGGSAILSGILTHQADDVIAIYAENGLNLARRDDIVDWTTLTLRKYA